MKYLKLLPALLLVANTTLAQHIPLPHGMVFGIKPNTAFTIPAWRVEGFMAKKTRISVTISGRVLKVTNPKGGWFWLDAGKGKIIEAHFKNYGINIPINLKGRIIIAEGIAEKKFIADDLQHYAGDTVRGKRQHMVKADPLRRLTFEVKGLMVDQ